MSITLLLPVMVTPARRIWIDPTWTERVAISFAMRRHFSHVASRCCTLASRSSFRDSLTSCQVTEAVSQLAVTARAQPELDRASSPRATDLDRAAAAVHRAKNPIRASSRGICLLRRSNPDASRRGIPVMVRAAGELSTSLTSVVASRFVSC